MGAIVGIALVWFIIEMLIWYLIGRSFHGGGWLVFGWFVAAAFIGIAFIKKAAGTLNPMAQQMKSGVIPNPANQPPENTITKSIATGVAGLLLLIPGLLSDILALLLLLPFIQKKLVAKAKNYALNNQDKMMAMMANQMGGNSPFGGMGGMGGTKGTGNNPFGGSPYGSGSPFGRGTTIDGQAKNIQKDSKNTKSANDD